MEKNPEKGFEGADGDSTVEVNTMEEMERAKREIQEREEAKALTQGGSGEQKAAPKMNVKVCISSNFNVIHPELT